jgi:hypothetical protein
VLSFGLPLGIPRSAFLEAGMFGRALVANVGSEQDLLLDLLGGLIRQR